MSSRSSGRSCIKSNTDSTFGSNFSNRNSIDSCCSNCSHRIVAVAKVHGIVVLVVVLVVAAVVIVVVWVVVIIVPVIIAVSVVVAVLVIVVVILVVVVLWG